ncbi:MAG: GPW/gp25 family protein [Ardenticatenaceae bacterium]|nr:GPW/gp25 family protein [Ardenticatenaceae bacterium]
MISNSQLFGQGLGFPPRVGADGRLVWSQGEENVRESIRLILLTEPGERIMREGFGCGLRQFLFEPNTVATRQLIRERITEAIGRWEPRVKVQEVTVDADPDNPRLAAVTIRFKLIATGSVQRLGLTVQLEG